MNVHITYKLSKTSDVEQAIQQQVEKLRKRLHVFKPDMVSLHGSIEEGNKRGFIVSLNLSLPTGQIAARSSTETLAPAIKSSFDDLIEQVTKHKDHLRNHHSWPRNKRMERGRYQQQVPFEETLAAVQTPTISKEDIAGFVNVNLQKLERFVSNEMRFRISRGRPHLERIATEEVIDEVIANALDDRKERPEKVALEPWLYRLARRAMDRLANQSRPEAPSVSVNLLVPREKDDGHDDVIEEYDQPDEMLTNENLIADGRTATPEDIAANDEVVAMVDAALRHTRHEDREAFILNTMEGFTVQEIGTITERPEQEVRESIRRAREHLRKAIPVPDKTKSKTTAHSESA